MDRQNDVDILILVSIITEISASSELKSVATFLHKTSQKVTFKHILFSKATEKLSKSHNPYRCKINLLREMLNVYILNLQ